MDIKYNFITDLHNNDIVNVKYINADNQTAVILTKALPKHSFNKLSEKLGVKMIILNKQVDC